MLAAGWNAHTLNAPGKFLIAAAEHDTPRRARAYLLTDESAAGTASRYAGLRPPLDEASQQAIDEPWRAEPPDAAEQDSPPEDGQAGSGGPGPGPEALLWAALCVAPDDGVSVPDLMHHTGMGRRWVYYRLTALAAAGRAAQITRGQWRATPGGGDDE